MKVIEENAPRRNARAEAMSSDQVGINHAQPWLEEFLEHDAKQVDRFNALVSSLEAAVDRLLPVPPENAETGSGAPTTKGGRIGELAILHDARTRLADRLLSAVQHLERIA